MTPETYTLTLTAADLTRTTDGWYEIDEIKHGGDVRVEGVDRLRVKGDVRIRGYADIGGNAGGVMGHCNRLAAFVLFASMMAPVGCGDSQSSAGTTRDDEAETTVEDAAIDNAPPATLEDALANALYEGDIAIHLREDGAAYVKIANTLWYVEGAEATRVREVGEDSHSVESGRE